MTDVVGVAGVSGPGGTYDFYGTTVDVTPDGQSVVATYCHDDQLFIGITNVSGGAFGVLYAGDTCEEFAADNPAVSPDGTKVVSTGGEDNPQLDISSTTPSLGQPITVIAGFGDFPAQPDWQPRS